MSLTRDRLTRETFLTTDFSRIFGERNSPANTLRLEGRRPAEMPVDINLRICIDRPGKYVWTISRLPLRFTGKVFEKLQRLHSTG